MVWVWDRFPSVVKADWSAMICSRALLSTVSLELVVVTILKIGTLFPKWDVPVSGFCVSDGTHGFVFPPWFGSGRDGSVVMTGVKSVG